MLCYCLSARTSLTVYYEDLQVTVILGRTRSLLYTNTLSNASPNAYAPHVVCLLLAVLSNVPPLPCKGKRRLLPVEVKVQVGRSTSFLLPSSSICSLEVLRSSPLLRLLPTTTHSLFLYALFGASLVACKEPTNFFIFSLLNQSRFLRNG